MLPRTGVSVRTTSGSATSACAIGTSSGLSRRSSGGRSRVMRKPKPSVTALTPSGSMKKPSSAVRTRRSRTECERRVTTAATRSPVSSAIQVASTAVRRLVASAAVTGTSSAWLSPTVVRAR